jgi:aryl-alcohol dehydrogenase-like predicted oxidoreductase
MTHPAGPQDWHVPNTSRPWLRPVGQTGLTVSAICAGGSPLGSMPENFGYEVSEAQAVDLVEAILESPIRFLDTSNGYSEGESERRIGKAIKRHGGLPPDFLVAKKSMPSDPTTQVPESNNRSERAKNGSESTGCRWSTCTTRSSTPSST